MKRPHRLSQKSNLSLQQPQVLISNVNPCSELQKVAFSAAGSDLVAAIISQLTPFIQQTVSSSLSGSSSGPAQPVASTQTINPGPSRPLATSVEGIFGVSGQNNVKVQTPNFNFEYELQK